MVRLKKEWYGEAKARSSHKPLGGVPCEVHLNKTCFPGEACGPFRNDQRAGR